MEKFRFEEEARSFGYRKIAGVDEAGRGPLAGPLVVASIILPPSFSLFDIDDSKKLSPDRRRLFFDRISKDPDYIYSVIVIEPFEIDRINILQATMLGMQRAVASLHISPDYVLVDGNRLPAFPCPGRAIVKGDALSYSIGAASVLAKVRRDTLMEEYDEKWPEYGFADHKGYPTKAHLQALKRFGPCPIHRTSYAPVKQVLASAIL